MSNNKILKYILDVDSATGEAKLREFKRELQSVDDTAKQSKSGWDKWNDSLRKSGEQISRTGKSLTMGLTLPIVGMAAATLKSAGDFEAGLNKVQAISGATGDQFEKLKKQAADLGATTQYTAGQAAEAMGFLAMAGFKADQILGAMPGTLQLAASAQIDLAQSADIVTNVLTGYRKGVEDLNHVNDVLVTAFTSANTNLVQLGEAMKYAGPVASAAGVGFEQATAALSMMGNAGIQASMAGTSLRGAISRILDPTKEAEARMKELGLSFTDASGRLIPFDQIVQQLEKHADDAGLFIELFGQRAGPGMAALVSQGSEALRVLTGRLEESGGVSKRIADVQMKGFNGAMRELKSALEAFMIALGESGFLRLMTDFAKSLSQWFRELAKTNPELLKFGTTVAMVAAALGPLMWIIGSSLTGLATFSGALKTVGIAMGLVEGAAVPLTATIGIIAAAVAAFGLGLVDLAGDLKTAADRTRNYREVMEGQLTLWDRFKSVILGPIGAMGDLAESSLAARDALMRFTEGGLLEMFEPYQEDLQSAAQSFVDWVRYIEEQSDELAMWMAATWLEVSAAWERMIDIIANLSWDKVKEGFSDLIDWMKNKVTDWDPLWFVPSQDELAEWLIPTKDAMESMASDVRDVNKVIGDSHAEVADRMKEVYDRVAPVQGEFHKLHEEYKKGKKTKEEYEAAVDKLLDSLHKSTGAAKDNGEAAKAAAEAWKQMKQSFQEALNPADALRDKLGKLIGEFGQSDVIKVYWQEIIRVAEEQMELHGFLPEATQRLYDLAKAYRDNKEAAIEAQIGIEAADRAIRDFNESGLAPTIDNLPSASQATTGLMLDVYDLKGGVTDLSDAFIYWDYQAQIAKGTFEQLGGSTDKHSKKVRENGQAVKENSQFVREWQGVWQEAMGKVYDRFTTWVTDMLGVSNGFAKSMLDIFVTNLFKPFLGWISKLTEGFGSWIAGMVGMGPKVSFGSIFDMGKTALGIGKAFGIGAGAATTVTNAAGMAWPTLASGGAPGYLLESIGVQSGTGAGGGGLLPFLTNPWTLGIAGAAVGGTMLYKWLKDPNRLASKEAGRDFGVDVSKSTIEDFYKGVGLDKDRFKDIRKDLESSPQFFKNILLPAAEASGTVDDLISKFGQLEAFGRRYDFSAGAAAAAAGDYSLLNQQFEELFSQSQALQTNLPNWREVLTVPVQEATAAVDDFNKAIETSGAETLKEADRVGREVRVGTELATEATRRLREAVEEMPPAFERMFGEGLRGKIDAFRDRLADLTYEDLQRLGSVGGIIGESLREIFDKAGMSLEDLQSKLREGIETRETVIDADRRSASSRSGRSVFKDAAGNPIPTDSQGNLMYVFGLPVTGYDGPPMKQGRLVGSFARGGIVPETGLAYVHKGETVIPAGTPTVNVQITVAPQVTVKSKSEDLVRTTREEVVPELLRMLRHNTRGVAEEVARSVQRTSRGVRA